MTRRSKWAEEDRSLIRLAQSGDRRAIAEVVKRYRHIARGYANKYRRNYRYNEHDIQDIEADGLESILKAIREYGTKRLDADGQPYPFWRTVWFTIRGDAQYKRKKRDRQKTTEVQVEPTELWERFDGSDDSDDEIVNNQRHYRRAWEIASSMKPIYWIVWRLYYGRDMAEADIGRELNVTRQCINHRLQRARAYVRGVMSDEGYDVKE